MQAENIINIEKIGLMRTVDIEVNSPNHLFYGDGVATCNSHAVSYALNCYLSSYAKAHFPKVFFTSYLYYAKEKQKPREEIAKLVNNARLMNINVEPPNFKHLNKDFTLKNNKIHFGFIDIKGIGESVIDNLQMSVRDVEKQLDKKHEDFTWSDFLIYLSPNIKTTAARALICSGSLDYMNITRSQMLFEYETYNKLSKRERKYVENNVGPNTDLRGVLELLVNSPVGRTGGCANIRRAEKINGLLNTVNNPPSTFKDLPAWVSSTEESLLGISLTTSVVEGCDKRAANYTCKDILEETYKKNEPILIAVQINSVKETITKRGKSPGQRMGFLSIGDSTGTLDLVVWPAQWNQFSNLLLEDNTVLISCKPTKNKQSLEVIKMFQI